ncbi:MAG: drug/metabolite transporter (DMT)-like permease [Paracoccaceae bacterium]|jgi:drug/metabolite transporter (DMT)-like permease
MPVANAPPTPPRPEVIDRGIMFAVIAVVIFAAQDGLSKHLASTYSPVFVVTVRYWAFAAFALALSARRPGGIRATARTAHPWLQIGRGTLLAFQVVIAITAFAKVGLGHSHAIMASAPLIVAALSMPILGEPVGWRRWLAIAVGFCGIMLILRPGVGDANADVLYAVAGAIGIALYGLMTRLAGRYDGPDTSFFYTGVAGAAAITLVGIWSAENMTVGDWGWMALLCVTGMSGHYFLIRAFALSSAVVVQPITYLQLVLATFIGIFLFGESVDGLTVLGATIVVLAGLFTAWRESVAKRRKATQAPIA